MKLIFQQMKKKNTKQNQKNKIIKEKKGRTIPIKKKKKC